MTTWLKVFILLFYWCKQCGTYKSVCSKIFLNDKYLVVLLLAIWSVHTFTVTGGEYSIFVNISVKCVLSQTTESRICKYSLRHVILIPGAEMLASPEKTSILWMRIFVSRVPSSKEWSTWRIFVKFDLHTKLVRIFVFADCIFTPLLWKICPTYATNRINTYNLNCNLVIPPSN